MRSTNKNASREPKDTRNWGKCSQRGKSGIIESWGFFKKERRKLCLRYGPLTPRTSNICRTLLTETCANKYTNTKTGNNNCTPTITGRQYTKTNNIFKDNTKICSRYNTPHEHENGMYTNGTPRGYGCRWQRATKTPRCQKQQSFKFTPGNKTTKQCGSNEGYTDISTTG